jgi:hypothetical protein
MTIVPTELSLFQPDEVNVRLLSRDFCALGKLVSIRRRNKPQQNTVWSVLLPVRESTEMKEHPPSHYSLQAKQSLMPAACSLKVIRITSELSSYPTDNTNTLCLHYNSDLLMLFKQRSLFIMRPYETHKTTVRKGRTFF